MGTCDDCKSKFPLEEERYEKLKKNNNFFLCLFCEMKYFKIMGDALEKGFTYTLDLVNYIRTNGRATKSLLHPEKLKEGIDHLKLYEDLDELILKEDVLVDFDERGKKSYSISNKGLNKSDDDLDELLHLIRLSEKDWNAYVKDAQREYLLEQKNKASKK